MRSFLLPSHAYCEGYTCPAAGESHHEASQGVQLLASPGTGAPFYLFALYSGIYVQVSTVATPITHSLSPFFFFSEQYEYMIDNVMLLLKGTLSGRSVEVIPTCLPLF
jgi:hypothetical protein